MAAPQLTSVGSKIAVKAAIIGDITVGKTTFISSLSDYELYRTYLDLNGRSEDSDACLSGFWRSSPASLMIAKRTVRIKDLEISCVMFDTGGAGV